MTHTPETRSHRVGGSVCVDAPPTAVWNVLSDFHNVDRWAGNVTRVIDIGHRPRGLGAARHCEVRGVGSMDEHVVEWDEGKGLGYSVSALGPIAGATSRWRLEPADGDRTRVELTLGYDMRLGPLGTALQRAVVQRVLDRRLPQALRALKRYVEREHTRAGLPEDAVCWPIR